MPHRSAPLLDAGAGGTLERVMTIAEVRPVQGADAAKYWYLLAISGAISAVVGVLVIAYPSPSVKLLGVFLGIELLLGGILPLARPRGRTRLEAVLSGARQH